MVALGDPDLSQYTYLNTNWESFGLEREMFGIWGYQDFSTGYLNALGFVVKDNSCTGKFVEEVGADYTWTSYAPGI